MRLVLGARHVAQNLQALAIFYRPLQQVSQSLLNAGDQLGLAPLEEHALAGAVYVFLFAAGLDRDRQ